MANKAELSFGTKLKLAVKTPVVKCLFRALPYLSEGTVTAVVRRLCGENQYPDGQKFIEKAFASLKHIFKTTNSNCRRSIIANMIIAEGVRGQKVRRQITQELGFDLPLLIVVSPTQRCPLKCYGCYAAEHPRSEELEFKRFDRLVEECKELGIYFIVVSGGEPYIYPRIFEIFEKHSDVYFQTYTSGYTIATTNHAKRLARLGNVLPCISVEGFEVETDKRRGAGHFKRILKAMENLRGEGVPFGFSATATRENSATLMSDEFVDFYIGQGCSAGYYFQYMPIGRAPVFDLVPTPEQRIERYERIQKLRAAKPILLADFWCDGPLVGGCLAAGRRYVHVNNLGNVEPCVFSQAYDMNIYEHSFADILKNSRLFKAIRKRQPYSDNLLRPCMIIDVPDCWRDAVAESGATYSYPTAGNVAKELKENIEKFAGEYARLADPIWEERYKQRYRERNAYVHGMRKKFEIPQDSTSKE